MRQPIGEPVGPRISLSAPVPAFEDRAHLIHVASFLLLLGTGILLFWPAARGVLIGGYSLVIRRIHLWLGIPFVLAPLPLLGQLARIARRTATPGSPASEAQMWLKRWRWAHSALTLAAAAIFAITGWIIWPPTNLDQYLVDRSHALHLWLTYAISAVLVVHVAVVVLARYAWLDLNNFTFLAKRYSGSEDPPGPIRRRRRR
jgi:cytochrome b subunit of formate dehydrogenase